MDPRDPGVWSGFRLGIFSGGQNLLLCKFLLLCYRFRTKFQGGNCRRGAPPAPPLLKKASGVYNMPTGILQNAASSNTALIMFILACLSPIFNPIDIWVNSKNLNV